MHSNPSDDIDGVVRELRNARHIVSKNLELLRRVDVSKLTPEDHSRHDTNVTAHRIALRILAPELLARRDLRELRLAIMRLEHLSDLSASGSCT
jgi:hypothetical protein